MSSGTHLDPDTQILVSEAVDNRTMARKEKDEGSRPGLLVFQVRVKAQLYSANIICAVPCNAV